MVTSRLACEDYGVTIRSTSRVKSALGVVATVLSAVFTGVDEPIMPDSELLIYRLDDRTIVRSMLSYETPERRPMTEVRDEIRDDLQVLNVGTFEKKWDIGA